MNYKKDIIKMLSEIESECRLESIYIITKKNFDKENENKKKKNKR